MAKVITFSRTYPAKHPRAGQQTLFVEKIIMGLWSMNIDPSAWKKKVPLDFLKSMSNPVPVSEIQTKFTTIRAGRRFKAGEMFSPRVWSGKPYNSPQIQFCMDLEVVKTWDIEKRNGEWDMPTAQATTVIDNIANNDGLFLPDFQSWFPAEFSGQIICWNPRLQY